MHERIGIAMRPWLALLVAGLLGTGMLACGGADKTADTRLNSPTESGQAGGQTATAGSKSAARGGYVHEDGDKDTDDEAGRRGENDIESLIADYGTGAKPADVRAIGALVKRYLKASAIDSGAETCSMLAAPLAQELAEGSSGAADGSHKTCVQAMSLLLQQQQQKPTTAEVATMTVITVRVKGPLGLAELGFRALPEQQMVVEREDDAWKVASLLAGDLI